MLMTKAERKTVDQLATALVAAANTITTLTGTCGLLREALSESAATQFDDAGSTAAVAQARAIADEYRAFAQAVKRASRR
jgi:hypothetical protein